MSTLSGIAAKGEKGKSKFQSLDINSLYKASRGESLETHPHKNTASRRHGMQTLGKIPSARRAPANLPSLKSEYSGNDPAISLVPSGGTGWGSKPGETGPPPTSTQAPTSSTPTPAVSNVATVPPTVTTSTVTTSSTPTVTPTTIPPPPPPIVPHTDKSWSSITSSNAEASPMFLAHQSPYFQQEFPSLSGDANASGPNKSDPGHLPGPSLRPQTEGSWMQGGSRPQGQMGAGAGSQQGTVPVQGPLPLPHLPQGLDVGVGRNNLGPSGVGVGPGGPLPPPAGMPPHHYRLMPQFMLRQNHPSGGFPPNFHGPPRLRFPYPPETRMMPPNREPPNAEHQDEITSRPIIKEEDLKVMDEISRDTGWAVHDEIDYNQTLTFSDDEGSKDDKRHQTHDKRESVKKAADKENEPIDSADKAIRDHPRELMNTAQHENREPPKGWQQQRPPDFRHGPPAMGNFPSQQPRNPPHQGGRQGEDEDVWRERRRIQNEEIAIAVERAKQRKEEEEKRYNETRQNAARKLQMLEEKMRSKTGGDKEDGSAPLNIQPASNALLPDWEKEKEKNRSRKNSEDKEEKSSKEPDLGKNQMENRSGMRERDRERDGRDNVQGFSRMFQNNLPPRFQKQAADRPSQHYRQNSSSSPQPTSMAQPSFDARWTSGPHYGSAGNVKPPRSRNDSDLSERDREESKEPLRERDRNTADMGFDNRDRERYNRPPSRDSKERINESGWKGAAYTDDTAVKLENDYGYEGDNRLHEKNQEFEESKEKEKEFTFYEENVNSEKRSNENFKNMHFIQEDPFNQRVKNENERRDNLTKLEMRERPQRPDSRDSRASRDSRNSRDSNREDNKFFEESNLHEPALAPWAADSTYDMENRDEKLRKDNREERDHRRDINTMHQQSFYQRHNIPGPITKEKLEAAEKCESAKNINLVPLVRGDKKPDIMKPINQWETAGTGGDAWQQMSNLSHSLASNSECWADISAPLQMRAQPTPPHSPDVRDGNKPEAQDRKVDLEENKTGSKPSFQEKDEMENNQRSDMQRRDKMGGRGGGGGNNRGMRGHDRGPRGWGSGSYYRGGSTAYRGEPRGGRRSQNRKPRGEWGHSESEASADEVSASTESGKEDKRHEHDKHYPRSPKHGSRKSDKDDRPRDNRKQDGDKDYSNVNDNRRHDKRGMYDNSRMGSFEPRGEPSRRGRGTPFRSKGSAANVGRRMDGYGPPTSKRPFTSDSNNIRDEKKPDSSSLIQSGNKEDAFSKLSHDEKMKLNQQQLAAGIIGGARLGFKSQPSNMPPRLRRKSEGERRERKPRERGGQNCTKSGSGSGGEVDDWETTSETSEHEDKEAEHDDDRRNDKRNLRGPPRRQPQLNRGNGKDRRRGNSFDRDGEHSSKMSGQQSMVNGRPAGGKSGASTKDQQQQDSKPTDLSDKNRGRQDNKEKRNNLDKIDLCNTASVVVVDDQPETTVEQDRTVFAPDNNGFQEVRSKKNVKDSNRQKEEPQKGSRERDRERDRERGKKSGSSQSPAQAPGAAAQAAKGSYERTRGGSKLAPRFVKMRENNRLQKIAQQQTQDVSDLNKINTSNVTAFPVKELTSPAPPPPVNAWDKPINATLRTVTPPVYPVTSIPPPEPEPCIIESNEPDNSTASSQRSSPNGDKLLNKISREPSEKTVLDGTSPPVQTIIFENTNFKSTPGDVAMKSKYNTNHLPKPQRPEKPRERKLEDENVALGFKSPGPDMKLNETKNDPIQMPISFNKNEDNADMKLDFRFDSDLSQLTEDKTSKSMASMQMTRSIQMASQSSAADLQFKLASVKKVWENPASMLEHGVGAEDNSSVVTATSFTPTFTNSVDDANAYGKPSDPSVPDDNTSITPENVYNPSQQMPNSANAYNGAGVNMIKSDPSSNVCKVKPQPQAAMHPHGGPLSPPAGPFTGSSSQPGQHLNYQPAAQYGGMPAIPSPPTVFTPQPEIYQTFQINSPQVMGNQGRSGFSQFTSQGLGYISQGLGQTSGFNQQSLYHVPTAPPPTAAPPPPEVYQTQQNLFRIQPPYGSQQLNSNPNTVLISSTANSLMSASVKPSPQPPPIGAIGTKAASYQTPSQPPHSQLYIYSSEPPMLSQNAYLQNSQLVARPANNVMQTIPPSSASYYSANTGGAAGGFFQPANSNMQAGPSLHQTTFNMQAFNTQSAAGTPAGMGSFGSQMAQQYRSTAPLPSYLKSADLNHQDHLSVFSSPSPVTQINPAKPRGGGGGSGKQGGGNGACPPQQQSSPTQGHHQFSSYQTNVSATTQFMMQQQGQQQRGNVSMRPPSRYPSPIQRPDQTTRRVPPTRPSYKPSPAQSAANANYYVPHNDSAKLANSDLETKVDPVSSECEPMSSSSNSKAADIAVEKSSAEN